MRRYLRVEEYQRVWDRQYSTEVDRLTQVDCKLSGLVLMELAGKQLADFVMNHSPLQQPITVLVGNGNNGGDGLVAARYLYECGYEVEVVLVFSSSDLKISPQCKANLDALRAIGFKEVRYYRFGCLKDRGNAARTVIDAIFGIGYRPPMTSVVARDCIEEQNQRKSDLVISVDIPSGMPVDIEEPVSTHVIHASHTLTFGQVKPCLIWEGFRSLAGQVVVAELPFPSLARSRAAQSFPTKVVRVNPQLLMRSRLWEELARDANKYDRGQCLVIGGSEGKYGAPLLAARAALRAGVGWVTVADTPNQDLARARFGADLEFTFEKLLDAGGKPDWKLVGDFCRDRRVGSIVIGPGWTNQLLDSDAVKILVELQKSLQTFIVIDAGGTRDLFKLLRDNPLSAELTACTPHPGEWQRAGLPFNPKFGLGTWDLSALEASGATWVFKGSAPIVFTKSMAPAIVDVGTSKLARAGSGDVLAGVIAAHGLAQWSAHAAVCRALVVLEVAASIAAQGTGNHAVLATDIIGNLGLVV